jgi:hypothetical protein
VFRVVFFKWLKLPLFFARACFLAGTASDQGDQDDDSLLDGVNASEYDDSLQGTDRLYLVPMDGSVI